MTSKLIITVLLLSRSSVVGLFLRLFIAFYYFLFITLHLYRKFTPTHFFLNPNQLEARTITCHFYWTYLYALITPNTFVFFYLWIFKSFFIFYHTNSRSWTNRIACSTTTAFLFFSYNTGIEASLIVLYLLFA